MRTLTIAAVASLVCAGAALAQTPKPAEKPRSTASLECSKQATEKGLHGKARRSFRSKCIKDMKSKS
jgi:psiF repeat